MLYLRNRTCQLYRSSATNRLQPSVVSVNKAANCKESLRRQFQQWYSDKVCLQLESKTAAQSVDLALSVVN